MRDYRRVTASLRWAVLRVQLRCGVLQSVGSSPVEVSAGVTGIITTADVGQPQLFVGVYTGSAARLYTKRMQQGADVAISFQPSASPLYLGRDAGGNGSEAMAAFGFAAGFGLPTLGQVQQLFDDVERAGRILPMPGFAASQLIDLTADITANGGPELGVPAQVLDRAEGGTDLHARGRSVSRHFGTARGSTDLTLSTCCVRQTLSIAGVGTGFWAVATSNRRRS